MASSESDGLRRLLTWVSLAIFVATPVELALQEHLEDLQRLAMLGCAFGLVGTSLVARHPLHERGATLKLGAALLVVTAGISVFGVWEHVEHNYGFAREIQPHLSAGEAFVKALFGASPPLAPGILGLGALLPLATRRASRAAMSETRE